MAIGILLLVAAALYRVAGAFYFHGAWGNFAPLTAIALCGGLFLPRFWAWAVPLSSLLTSDLILNAHYHFPLVNPPMLVSYACYAAVIAGGIALRRRPQAAWVPGSALAASLLFYVATNTASWLHESYAKTGAGWLQALTTGLPGYPPTWVFFRNSAASDFLFTGLYLGCMAATGVRTPVPARESLAVRQAV